MTGPRDPWTTDGAVAGLILRPWTPTPSDAPARLVACCSVRVSDVAVLLCNAATWRPFVDAVVVVLGSWSLPDAYAEVQAAAAAVRGAFGPTVRVVEPPPGGWRDQCEKRSAYFAAVPPGDVALVLDADERVVAGGAALRPWSLGGADVGWMTVANPTRYARPYKQPRLYRVPTQGLVYRGRHHWVWSGDRLVATHQYGGPGILHSIAAATVENHSPARRTERWREQFAAESGVGTRAVDRWAGAIEPLRILQMTRTDDGLVAYRLHSALNATTPHTSALTCGPHRFLGPTQYQWPDEKAAVAQALRGADVVHCHTDYSVLDGIGGPSGRPVVIHHHGTRYRKAVATWAALDAQRAVLRLCSNLDLVDRERRNAPQWLPNPVPVALYQRMAAAAVRSDGPLRVAHSPSQPLRKGTDVLLEAQKLLHHRGIEIAVELLTDMPHAEVLRRKAACDVTFDSFWLGIQCSGLEGAAMGQAVIAGDPEVAARYRTRLGAVPYTYANDVTTLAETLARMATDPVWRAAEAERVGAYVLQYHDEAAVAVRYLELLHTATGCWAWKPATATASMGRVRPMATARATSEDIERKMRIDRRRAAALMIANTPRKRERA